MENKTEIQEDEEKNKAEVFRRLRMTMSGGIIAISIVVLQAFIGADKLDIYENASVNFLALAIPMLGGCIIYYSLFSDRSRIDRNKIISALFFVGAICALLGVSFAFYHVSFRAFVFFFFISVPITILCVGFGTNGYKNLFRSLLSVIASYRLLIIPATLITYYLQRGKRGKLR